MNIFNFSGANRYYKMTDKELEIETSKRNIPPVGFCSVSLDRDTIITHLLMQDSAKNERCTFFIVILTFIVSVIALIKSFI